MMIHFYIPVEMFKQFFGILVGFIALVVFSFLLWVWNYNQKWMDDHVGTMEEYEEAFISALLKMLAYLAFSFPISMLMVVGASTYVHHHPSWYVPLLLFTVLVPLAITFYLVVLPLCRLGFAIAKLGAISINDYMKEKYPLRYL
jgi:hypothetical protein